MRILFLILFFLSAFSAHALTRPQLEALLKEKGVDLVEVEMRGVRVLMGEVSGHLNALPFSKVHALVTEEEAILKQEVESVDAHSVRFNGQYVLKQDVKAILVK